jgi:hypothetical protein
VTADDLHRVLDGLTGGDARQIRVASVVIAQERRWIQIDLVGARHYSCWSAPISPGPGHDSHRPPVLADR